MTDNQRLRAFVAPYMELLRTDTGVSYLEHEMIALVSAATNDCIYCTAHHGMLMRADSTVCYSTMGYSQFLSMLRAIIQR